MTPFAQSAGRMSMLSQSVLFQAEEMAHDVGHMLDKQEHPSSNSDQPC